MKKKVFTQLNILFAGLFILSSCSNDDNNLTPVNEEELITQVVLTVLENGTDTGTTYFWNEGQGASTLNLENGKSYTVNIAFLNNSNPSSPENITEEVIAEADEHLVFYEVLNASVAIAPSASDVKDSQNIPLGITTNWTVDGSSNGSVRIYLIHEPTAKTGTTRNDLGGETDVQIDFPVAIQ